MRTIGELLEAIKSLQTREAAGEDVKDELTSLRAELEQAKAAQTAPAPAPAATLSASDQQELETLRAAQRATAEAGQVKQVAMQVVEAVQADQRAQQERVTAQAVEVVKQMLGGGNDLDSAVQQALAAQRGGSRFAGPGSSQQVADVLAAGGSLGGSLVPGAQQGLGGVAVGEHQGVKAIEEGKNLAQFLSIIHRSKALGPLGLTEAEQLFLRKQFDPELASKAMAQGTPSAGGYLVPEQWMPDILTPLRAAAVVRRAGPRIVQFDKQMNQVQMSTGAVAYYIAENARITPSEPTVAQQPILTPHYLTALVPVGNVLLGNWENGDQIIRDDMTDAVATREDLSFLQGTGGAEPTGFRTNASAIVNPLAPGANGFIPTLPQLRQLKGRTRMVAAPNPRWSWFFNPAILTYLESLTDTTGRFLVDAGILNINDDGVSGTFLGFPFYASYQIPVNLTMGTSTNVSYILLVEMRDAIVGEEQALSLAVSDQATYSPDGGTTHISAFQQNQTVFRAILAHDVTHRRPGTGIIVQEGVRV
jgi:HK97 family phage major capsid protein